MQGLFDRYTLSNFVILHAFGSDTLGNSTFQHFDALSVVWNIQAVEIHLGFRDDLLI